MKPPAIAVTLTAFLSGWAAAQTHVGPAEGGGDVVTTTQLIRPAGRTLVIRGRPVDLAVSPLGDYAYAKDDRGLVVIDLASWTGVQKIPFPGEHGGSMTGLAVSADGQRVYATDSNDSLLEFVRSADGSLAPRRTIRLPGPDDEASFPCGIALTPDGSRALVCLSCNNTLGIVNLATGELERQIEVGIAPFAVALSPDGSAAYVTDWGGRRVRPDELSATSSGTPVLIDPRGIAASGGLSIVDLASGKETAFVETGLSACAVAVMPDGSRVLVANANSDTVSIIDPAARAVTAQITVRPDESLPFGSMPDALALTADGRTLFVACAGNNALAQIDLSDDRAQIRGWIPAGWYPGAIVARPDELLVANIKGIGSRAPRREDGTFNSRRYAGTIQRTPVPNDDELAAMTRQVLADSRVPETLRAVERREHAEAVSPEPVPSAPGRPSVIEHVFYIIKENRTYDQVFGDLAAGDPASGDRPRGNGEPRLCIYGREATPNQHALAEQFVLLDNFYCNGVLSADGHSWATEGNVTPYLERSFGGFVRSYTFGDDPLTYSSSGFIWDHVLAAGRSFRNYGEFDYAKPSPASSWPEVWADWQAKAGKITIGHSIGVENVRRYSNPDSPGWNLDIPDQIRADIFLGEFKRLDEAGTVPNFVLIYLPQDHTMGIVEGGPTPRACIADNDWALGRIIEGVSHARCWPTSAVFVVEDDPQDGWDHVDGHRSTCQVVSPYTRRGAVVSDFYNQSSVVHTIERILGATAGAQLYAMAPLMSGCFIGPGDAPDPRPFDVLPPRLAIDELTPAKSAAAPEALPLYEQTASLNLREPDRADEDTFNRVLWQAARGSEPYPAEWAGAHGKGLAALGLMLDGAVQKNDEEEEGDDGE